MADEGIRSANQIQAEGPNHEIRNVKVNANGELLVAGATTETVERVKVLGNGTAPATISVPGRVHTISIANTNEADAISLQLGQDTTAYTIPAGLALDIPVNAEIGSVSITGAGDADTYFLMATVYESYTPEG